MMIVKYLPIAILLYLSTCLMAQPGQIEWTKKDTIKPFIGALDPNSWNGIIAYDKNDQLFAYRVGAYTYEGSELKYIDGGKPFYKSVYKVGTKDVNGLYAELDWKLSSNTTWNFKWGCVEPRVVTALIKQNQASKQNSGIIVECYLPWDYNGIYTLKDDHIECSNSNYKLYFNSKPTYVSSVEQVVDQGFVKGVVEDRVKNGNSGKALILVFKDATSLSLKLTETLGVLPSQPEIENSLAKNKAKVLNDRMQVKGVYADAPESIIDNLNWMVSLIPHTDYRYIPAGRTWAWGGWTLFEWDSFFNAILVSTNDMNLAFSELEALYKMQYPNGNLPNYRGPFDASPDRSQPPVGSYLVWKLYQKSGYEKRWLTLSYPVLKKWYNWWTAVRSTEKPRRDGNNDGLLEWGTDATDSLQYAKYECGMDDSPLWDDADFQVDRWVMDINALDLNCLRAMDVEYLSWMAAELGEKEDVLFFENEYQKLKKLINEKMWDEKTGFYYDLFWDGHLSKAKAASNFYPLIAGIASPERAALLIKKLTDPTLFWGDYIIPTISRDHKAFKDQQYWRGTIWPPTNYLVYEGLKRYHLDSIASEFAVRSADLFLNNFRTNGTCQENYSSITGKGGGQPFQSWGPLFSLIAIEELMDVTGQNELRFGSFNSKLEGIKNMKVGTNRYMVENGKLGVKVFKNDQPLFQTNCPAVITMKRVSGKYSFSINCLTEGEFRFYSPNVKRLLNKGINTFEL